MKIWDEPDKGEQGGCGYVGLSAALPELFLWVVGKTKANVCLLTFKVQIFWEDHSFFDIT
jgi:hypothetical protein